MRVACGSDRQLHVRDLRCPFKCKLFYYNFYTFTLSGGKAGVSGSFVGTRHVCGRPDRVGVTGTGMHACGAGSTFSPWGGGGGNAALQP